MGNGEAFSFETGHIDGHYVCKASTDVSTMPVSWAYNTRQPDLSTHASVVQPFTRNSSRSSSRINKHLTTSGSSRLCTRKGCTTDTKHLACGPSPQPTEIACIGAATTISTSTMSTALRSKPGGTPAVPPGYLSTGVFLDKWPGREGPGNVEY